MTTSRYVKCNATSKRTGQPCQRWAVNGSSKCQVHGGVTPRGIASPHFKTGRYSKAMPARLMERFNAALDDPDLLNLSSEIALVQARIEELVGRLDSAESGAVWHDLRETWKDFKRAQKDGNKLEVPRLLDDIDSLIRRGYGDHAVFNELGNNLELLRKLTESRRKHLIEMNYVVKLEEFGLFLSALKDSLLRHVHDRKVLSAIQNDITDLLTRQAQTLPQPDDVILNE